MIEKALIQRLSVAPVSSWGLVEARQRLLSEFLAKKTRTVAEVDKAAQAVGLSRRMFYRLIQQHGRCGEATNLAVPRLGRARPINPEQEGLIADAIAHLGPGARTRDVHALATSMSEERHVAPPGEYAIGRRVRLPRERVELAERLEHRCEWIVDTCELNFSLDVPGRRDPACLTTLIHVPTGETIAHVLHVGRPQRPDIRNLLLEGLSRFRVSNGEQKVVVTRTLSREIDAMEGIIASREITVSECPPHTVRSGEAMLMVFGRRLGSIVLRPRPRRSSTELPCVRHRLASAVVDHLIGCRNEQLSAACSRTKTEATFRSPAAFTHPQHRSAPLTA